MWTRGRRVVAGKTKEAWRILKAWHREAVDTATKPWHASMERQTVEWEELYDFKALPGEHIPVNRDPNPSPDTPLNEEIRTAVKRLRNGTKGHEGAGNT